ncbi:hypothetical protein [Embleya sp. MST-111070]|uniref:hypothetical protein n=1 Tax=Embleya sp. MST-111070 TaxID=3398231 RepID=UPI003F73C091
MAQPTDLHPDIEHMLELLAMIPGPDDIDFWNDVNAGRYTSGPEGGLLDSGYFTGKVRTFLHRYLATGDPVDAAALAKYLLVFFDYDADSLRGAVDFAVGDAPRLVLGPRWIADMTDTAWRVYVHNGGRHIVKLPWREVLADKWPETRDRTPTTQD